MQKGSTEGNNRCSSVDWNLPEEWDILATMSERRQMRWGGMGQENNGQSWNMTKREVSQLTNDSSKHILKDLNEVAWLILNWI